MNFGNDSLFPIPKIPAQNVMHRIVAREIFGTKYHRSVVDRNRKFYTNIYPNYSIVNIKRPLIYFRKFTPDGKRFIAFSQAQKDLMIYTYLGPSECNKNLDRCPPGDYLPVNSNEDVEELRSNAFSNFFDLEHEIALCQDPHHLNRECSLFSEDGDYIIVGSGYNISPDPHHTMEHLNQNNESVAPNPKHFLDNVTIYSIEIASGVICDKLDFHNDKIILAHNQSIYLYKSILAVISIQHQTIHIYKYYNGKFTPITKVGRLLYDNDEYILSFALSAKQQSEMPFNHPGNQQYRAYREKTINLLKHRILVYLYRRAVAISKRDNNDAEMKRFYSTFEEVCSLRMWKMQLLDEQHLFIKYTTEDVVTFRTYEYGGLSAFFVIYNFVTTEVIGVYHNLCKHLCNYFENFCDYFRNCNIDMQNGEFGYSQSTSSPSNNIHGRLIQSRYKESIINTKNAGISEAIKRILSQLPVSAQSYSCSPYLDQCLFGYDEKWISSLERPKTSSEQPIHFFARDTGLYKFKIHVGVPDFSLPPGRNLVAFILHPVDPFAISVQKIRQHYIVNFHIRRDH